MTGVGDEPVVIDVTRLVRRARRGHAATGIDRVGLEYVARYGARGRALLRAGPLWSVLDAEDSAHVFAALADWRPLSIGWLCRAHTRALWHAHGPARGRAEGERPRGAAWLINVVHSGTEAHGYRRRIHTARWHALYLLHDLIPLTHPQHCRPGESRRHARRLHTMLHSGAVIVTNSRDTTTRLLNYAAATQGPVPMLVTAPLGVTRLPDPGPRPVARPYFVVVATIEARKNHALLLDVWTRLLAECGADAPDLVIIGRRGWLAEEVLARMANCRLLKPHLHVLHDSDDQALSTYVAHARALLYPSLVEGWGLPVAEALSLGVPVIASDLPVFREVAGDVPDYLDPQDVAAWQTTIKAHWQSDASAHAQARRRAHWQASSWDHHFGLVEAAWAQQSRVAAAVSVTHGWSHAA